MKYYQSLFILCLFFLVVSCSGPKDELEQRISRALRDNQGLSAEECDDIHALILEHESLSEDYGKEKDLAKLIDQTANEMSKRKSSPIDYPLKNNCFTPLSTKVNAFNVYLENSASMDGYYNGLTEFKDALFHLLTQINGKHEPVSLHFINKETFPIKKDLDEFIAFLNPSSLTGLGDRGNSKLNNIVETVVNRYKKDGKTAILISDYIYSLSGSSNVQSQLPTIKYTIATTCQGLDPSKDAILIIKSQSAFNGTYYDMYNNKTVLNGSSRPFYCWVIGKKEMVYGFMKRYGIEKSKGYEDFLIIDHSSEGAAPYHAMLPHTFKKGRFSLCRDQRAPLCIEAIEFYDRENPPVLKLAVAVDLSGIPLKEVAKLDLSQYEVVSDKGDQLKIEAIKSISELDKNDERYRSTATHILLIRTESLYKGDQVIKIRMKKVIPQWVSTTSTVDDSGVQPGAKTFGLSYLIEGVNLAFNPNDVFFFEIPVTIRYN